MSLEFKIKDNKENRKKDVYELVTVGMSGDADAYETNNLLSDSKWLLERNSFEDAVKMTIACKIIFQQHGRHDFETEGYNALIEFAEKLGFEQDPMDFYSDLFGRDSTCDHQYVAAPSEIKLFYYDGNGDKFPVDIVVNGLTYGAAGVRLELEDLLNDTRKNTR